MKKILIVAVIAGVSVGILFGKHSSVNAKLSSPASPTSRFATLLQNLVSSSDLSKVAIPTRLLIPKLGINTNIEPVGLDEQQRMEVPQSWNNVGWYKYGARPGDNGTAVIDGHLDSPTGAAIFWNLNQLKIGDHVTVIDQQQQTHLFIVTRKVLYSDSNFPLQTVFAATTTPTLNLITCGGIFNRQAQNYTDRLVIFTVLSQ